LDKGGKKAHKLKWKHVYQINDVTHNKMTASTEDVIG